MSYTIFIYEIFFDFYAYISFFFVYLQRDLISHKVRLIHT